MSGFIVGVIGASPKMSRYSNKAIRLLKHHGYKVIPINSAYDKIEGIMCIAFTKDVPHTVRELDLMSRVSHYEKDSNFFLRFFNSK